jgi:hypothetical protein
MENFDWAGFKASVRGQLRIRKIDFSEVEYVALNSRYWLPIEGFFELERIPDWLADEEDPWEAIDAEFRVVMKDGRWLQYICISNDPYYSHFRWIVPPERPVMACPFLLDRPHQ